jgi:hypothetical protein
MFLETSRVGRGADGNVDAYPFRTLSLEDNVVSSWRRGGNRLLSRIDRLDGRSMGAA